MSKILAFAGSNSSTSINFELIKYTISLIDGHEIQVLNMANCPFPMYSSDYEKENGFSNSLVELKNDIERANGLIVSVNEHNGNLSAYFKNLIDWLSRLERRFLNDKPIFLMATSGGKRGGMSALETAKNIFPRFGGTVVCTFSLPSYKENFDQNEGIISTDLSKEHRRALDEFLTKI